MWKGKGLGSENGILAHITSGGYYLPPIFHQYYIEQCCFQFFPATDDEVKGW